MSGSQRTPQERKDASNARLEHLGIPVAQALPLLETVEETQLRDPETALRRLVALWSVAGTAILRENPGFRDYIVANDLTAWLSTSERAFLLARKPDKMRVIHFSWQTEALYFLAWCAGLLPNIDLPFEQASVASILHLFPTRNEDSLEPLRQAISLRPKADILDWSDLLYRTHWAVRDAQLRGLPAPAGLVAGAVMEWHKAVNWLTCYGDIEDWDEVSTDT